MPLTELLRLLPPGYVLVNAEKIDARGLHAAFMAFYDPENDVENTEDDPIASDNARLSAAILNYLAFLGDNPR